MATKRIGDRFFFEAVGDIQIPPPATILVSFIATVTLDEVPEQGARQIRVEVPWTATMTRTQLFTAARDAARALLLAEGGGHTVP